MFLFLLLLCFVLGLGYSWDPELTKVYCFMMVETWAALKDDKMLGWSIRRCSTSFSVRNVQVQISWDTTSPPLGWLISKTVKMCRQRCAELGTLYIAGRIYTLSFHCLFVCTYMCVRFGGQGVSAHECWRTWKPEINVKNHIHLHVRPIPRASLAAGLHRDHVPEAVVMNGLPHTRRRSPLTSKPSSQHRCDLKSLVCLQKP